MQDENQVILQELLERYPVLAPLKQEIATAAGILTDCFAKGGMVFTCGNGGSAADADHIVGEFVKGFVRKRPIPEEDKAAFRKQADTAFLAERLQCGFRALNLMCQSSIYTAVQNDLDPNMGPAQQLYAMGRPGDVLIGISTSGNAKDVFYACRVAKVRGMKVIGLSGKTGGMLSQESDANLCVAEQETFKIQELHLPIYHALCRMAEAHFFKI